MVCSGVRPAMLGFLLVLGLVVMPAVHGGRPGNCCFQPIRELHASSSSGRGNRKLYEKFKAMFRQPRPQPPQRSRPRHEQLVEWELRRAPSGPDPLHHHDGGPKKPETP